MNRHAAYMLAFAFVAVAAVAVADEPATLPEVDETECGEIAHDSDCRTECGTCECCGPCYREICCPKTEVVTEKKPCWNVNCEKVCVPAIRLPWEPGGSPLTLFNCLWGGRERNVQCTCADCAAAADCCETCSGCVACCHCKPVRCGTVRAVHVLEEDSYDVKKCETSWEIKRIVPACHRDCGACCADCPDCTTIDEVHDEAANDSTLEQDALMDAPLPPALQ